MAGFGNRHPRRGNIPSLNTLALQQGEHGITSPGTGYDMNFTPLLPSQLLLGSPFQPGSPGPFGSTQFPTFTIPQTHVLPNQQTLHSESMNQALIQQHQQQQQHHHQQQQYQPQPLSPQLFQPNMAQQSFPLQQMMVPQSPTGGFAGLLQQSLQYGGQAFAQQGALGGTSRTVYLGNIPPDTPAEEILNHVRSGAIESVRILADKHCAFIAFLEVSSATHFHSDAILKKLAIRGQEIKIGWGKPSQASASILAAVQQSAASRNVYLGNLPEEVTEEELREDLGKFGLIDTVKIVREKSIAFVHFLSIGCAIKTVANLPQEPKWQHPRRVNYGKDRCAYISKTQQQNAAQFLGIPAGHSHMLNGVDRDMISSALAQQSATAAAVATTAGGMNNMGNRTIYLGNIHPETTIEEICNVVRGGLLHHIRYIADKHICFVTFIDPTAAASFFAQSVIHGLMIHNRRLKLGWGKHSGALPPAIALAVAGGASRNVYIGNLDESWNEDRLRTDFSEYGEIELVNALREKSCAFVNFTNIQNAIKAIEAMRGQESYKKFKINFGKDRCGNPPRQFLGGHHNYQQHQQHQSQQMQHRQQQQNGMLTEIQDFDGEPLKGQAAHSQPGSSENASSPSRAERTISKVNGVGHTAPMMSMNPVSMPSLAPINPLVSYLNQVNQQTQQQMQHHNHGQIQMNGHQSNGFHSTRLQPTTQVQHSHRQSYDALASQFLQQPNQQRPSTDRLGTESHGQMNGITELMNVISIGPQHHQHHHRGSVGGFNNFAVSQALPNGNVNGLHSQTRASLAVPRAVHSRATSLPYISQAPQPQSNRGSINGFGGLGSGFGGLSSFTAGNFDQMPGLQERSLHGWPEEELRSS